MNDNSKGILDAFGQVRDVYRSVSKLLLASDAVLYERGFAAYDTWKAVEAKSLSHGNPDAWIQHRMVRQHHRLNRRDRELLTVGVMLWNPRADLVGEPLCIVSFLEVQSTNSYDVNWIPLMQAHDLSAPADGIVRYLDPTRWKTQGGSRDAFQEARPDGAHAERGASAGGDHVDDDARAAPRASAGGSGRVGLPYGRRSGANHGLIEWVSEARGRRAASASD